MRTAASLAVVAIAMGALGRPASGQTDSAPFVRRAQDAMANLNFERAIEHLERAEATGRNQREELIRIYRFLGECHASLGHDQEAEAEFRRFLALDPNGALAPGSSPKLTGPFDNAQRYMRRLDPLTVACERRGSGAVLLVDADPVGQVAGGRLLREDGRPLPDTEPVSGPAPIQLKVPAGGPRALACAVLDRHGNELARAPLLAASTGSRQRPGGEAHQGDAGDLMVPGDEIPGPKPFDPVAEEAPLEEADSPSLFARWWLWGATSLVAAGTGAYFTVRADDDENAWREIIRNSREHFYQEALHYQESGEKNRRNATIAFGTAAALATVSTIFIIRDVMRSRERAAPTAGIGAAPVHRGATATFWFTF